MKKSGLSYNGIANYYDFLSRLVFRKSQLNAQVHQLPYLSNCQRILIVGGGTGWILESLNVLPQTLQISYVEVSDAMLSLSKQRNTKHIVDFYNKDVELFEADEHFDAVLTPFLFDNFDEQKASAVFAHISRLLLPHSLWLYVDFHIQKESPLWHKMMLKAMHLFFGAIGAVKVKRLVDMMPYFAKAGWQLQNEKFYYAGFIKASVWHK